LIFRNQDAFIALFVDRIIHVANFQLNRYTKMKIENTIFEA